MAHQAQREISSAGRPSARAWRSASHIAAAMATTVRIPYHLSANGPSSMAIAPGDLNMPTRSARRSTLAGCADGCDDELGRLIADSHDVRQKPDVREARGLHGARPLLGREESTAGAMDRVESRGSERPRQIEDELRLDRPVGARAHALADHQAATGLERPAHLAQ